MKRAISSTPLPSRILVNTNGRCAAHLLGVAVHHLERGADIGREIDLVDDEQVGARDAGPALGRDLVAGRDIDDVDREIGKLRRKGRGEIVAAGFDQHQIEIGKARAHVGDGGEIDRGILADRGMRTAAGLDAGDALGRQRAGAHQIFGVPLGVDVVGDRRDLVAVAQLLAQRIHQRGLAGADRAADTDAQGTVGSFCVMIGTASYIGFRARIEARSARNAALPMIVERRMRARVRRSRR